MFYNNRAFLDYLFCCTLTDLQIEGPIANLQKSHSSHWPKSTIEFANYIPLDVLYIYFEGNKAKEFQLSQ